MKGERERKAGGGEEWREGKGGKGGRDGTPLCIFKFSLEQEFVRPRWPYDMRPSVHAEKYIRDAGP